MSFDIQIDTRFDSTRFFDNPDARAALDRAVEIWEGILLDEFEDVPAGIAFEIDDPSNAGTSRRVVLDRPIDDLLIFVGAEQVPGPLALGGFDGTGDGGSGLGDAFSSRVSANFRGQGPVTDFEPWVGTVSYDIDADWSFALETPEAGKPDFVSVSLHEIGHVLGFGTAAIFDQIGAGRVFDGPNALAATGGVPIPLQAGLGHVENGFAMDSVLMDPSLTNGRRVLPSEIDKAMLADIGWEIAGFTAQGGTPPLATDGPETIFGTAVGDTLDGLGGADVIQGEEGDDDLRGGAGDDRLRGGTGDDTLTGGTGDDVLQGGAGADLLRGGAGADTLFGQEGTDLFRVEAGDGVVRIQDFELGSERIEIAGAGFASAEAAVAAIAKPFGNVSRLAFGDGTQVDVFHDSQSGTPLMAAHFRVVDPVEDPAPQPDPGPDPDPGPEPDPVPGPDPEPDPMPEPDPVPDEIEGDAGRDDLTGTAAAEVIRGLGGRDLLVGGGGADTLEGGAGADTFAFLQGDLAGAAARIADFEDGDRIALDDRMFGLGGGDIDPRAVTQDQIRAALQNERAFYDGQTGALSIDLDGRRGGEAPTLLVVIEGGGRIDAEDLLLF